MVELKCLKLDIIEKIKVETPRMIEFEYLKLDINIALLDRIT
jgi:hypothetical protein